MTSWTIIYLTIGIIALLAAVWRIAKNGNLFLALAGITYCIVIVFNFFFGNLYNLLLVEGIPSLGRILHFIALPVFITIAIFSIKQK